MKIICIIQARMGSTRLPGKILMNLGSKPVLIRLIDRVKMAKTINKIIVATTDKKEDDIVIKTLKGIVDVFRGSENDVLDRYYQVAKAEKPDAVVRITGDCPLIDPEIINKIVNEFLDSNVDYVFNISNIFGEKTHPRGMDVEIMSFNALERAWKEAVGEEREHVTLYIRKNCDDFKCKRVASEKDYSCYRLTIDEEDDYKLVKKIYEILGSDPFFKLKDIIALLERNPDLPKINSHVEQKNKHLK